MAGSDVYWSGLAWLEPLRGSAPGWKIGMSQEERHGM